MIKLKKLLKESTFTTPTGKTMNLGQLYTDKDKPPFKTPKQIEEEKETIGEDKIVFSKDEMAKLHNDGQIEKDGHVIVFKEDVNEAYIDPDDAGKSINYALDDLKQSLKKVRNPEKWAEKYHRSLPGLIDMIERLNSILGKMK